MSAVRYIDRISRKEEKEKVYGEIFIQALYGTGVFSKFLSFFLLPLICKVPLFSKLYGAFQKSRYSRFKIRPFIETFQVDTAEFLEPVEAFTSFNDFFIRKLKLSTRPFASGNDVAIMPADGRYLVIPNLEKHEGIFVKGQIFSIEELLRDRQLAEKYAQGGMAIARLCPTDYHRFHFPCNGVPSESALINGPLFSVNPMALKRNIHYLTENKRMITKVQTKNFGTILYIEVGATYVGSIHQTFMAGEPFAKGDEKGYFAFGGSCLILLFEPFRIQFDQDLIDASLRRIETRGLLGQSLGRALSPQGFL
jgi:phosphatidylserine decarboxylase